MKVTDPTRDRARIGDCSALRYFDFASSAICQVQHLGIHWQLFDGRERQDLIKERDRDF